MAKKMYDIVPPRLARKVENTIKDLGVTPKKKRPVKAVAPLVKKSRGQKRFPLRELLVGGGVIVLLLGIYFYHALAKVEIQISPALSSVEFQEKITADKSAREVNVTQKIIPARYVEVQKEASQEFPATGSASNDGKASGTIKIYNKISPATSFVLKAGTHFLSDSGKYFVTLEKVTIPAMQKNTAGAISVRVEAEESGSESNVGPSKFSVPKLSGTAYYYTVWAESTSAMTGGHTGNVKKVTSDDLSGAKEIVVNKLLQEAEGELRGKLSQDDIILNGALVKNTVSTSASLKADALADNFSQTATVKVSALMLSTKDLQAFAKANISAKLSDTKSLLETSINLAYTPGLIDITKGTAQVNLQLAASTYYPVEAQDIIDLASQKDGAQIQAVVDQLYGDKVSNVTVNFWPFWVTKAPKNPDRIHVGLKFE